jgi:hypothetical protein
MRAHAERGARPSQLLGFRAGGRSVRSLGSLRQINLAAENSIVFNGKAKRPDIALNYASSPQFDTAAGHDVALYLALDQNIASSQIRGDVCVRPYRQAALGQRHRSFDSSVDDQVLSALYFPTNYNGFTNPSRTIFGCHGSNSFQNLKNLMRATQAAMNR